MDLNINTSGEIQLLELVHGAGCGINNVEEALVCANLELIGSLFIHVNRAINGKFFDPGWQRDRAGDFSSSALSSLDDLDSGTVDSPMVKCAKADADFLIHDEKVSGEMIVILSRLSIRHRARRRVYQLHYEALPRSTLAP